MPPAPLVPTPPNIRSPGRATINRCRCKGRTAAGIEDDRNAIPVIVVTLDMLCERCGDQRADELQPLSGRRVEQVEEGRLRGRWRHVIAIREGEGALYHRRMPARAVALAILDQAAQNQLGEFGRRDRRDDRAELADRLHLVVVIRSGRHGGPRSARDARRYRLIRRPFGSRAAAL